MVFFKRLILLPPNYVFPYFRPSLHLHGKSKSQSSELSVLSFLSNQSHIKEALQGLQSTENVGIDTYLRLLEACTRSKSLKEGKKIHDHIVRNDAHLKKNPDLLEKIVCMYVSCGEISLARHVFDEIRRPGIFLWNSMIRGYAWNGPFEGALDLYYRMIDLGVRPNKFTFPFVLKACSGLLSLEDAKEIHDHATKMGLDLDLFVSTALVDLYAKCGCLDNAFKLFKEMSNRDVVAWNAMIAGSAFHGLCDYAIGLVFQMQNEGTSPNSSSIVAVLPAVGQTKRLHYGKAIHGYCIRRVIGIGDVVVGTALLDMYAKCEYLDYTQRIFYSLSTTNEVTWSAMIGAYVICSQMKEAVTLYDKMVIEEYMNPTSATLVNVLRACAKLTDLNKGKQIHGYSSKSGFDLDLTVGNSLLSLYAKGGALDDAIRLFNEIKSKDTVSYSAIISGCVQNGNAKEALLIFHKMQLDGIEPDSATMVGVIPACAQLAALQHGRCNHGYVITRGFDIEISISNALIDMYSKCGRIDLAREIFDKMPTRDIVSWNAIVAGYGTHGLGSEAVSLFHNMQNSGLKPDDVTFICLLSACSHSGLVTEGKHWFLVMGQYFKIVPRMEHYICMVDLMGRAGLLDEAHKFIQQMPFEPDVRVWGALLGACRIHKSIALGEEVSAIIQRMGPEGTSNFVLLSNIYSAAGRWDDAANVRIVQKTRGFKKSPGCSWIEINGVVHAFVGGDRYHPQTLSIYETLEELLGEIKKLGYEADTSFVMQDVEEEEKEHILLYHSEKLAIAYGILTLAPGKPIIVTKNLRVCRDCHTAIKFISMITKRVITVRDASRFHHFRDGVCNCGDFW